MTNTHLWGIDLGGTKIEGVVLKSSIDPVVLYRDRIPTEADKGYDHIVSQIVKMVAMMSSAMGYHPTQIGFGTPGALDPQLNAMKNCNTTCLNGMRLQEDLVTRLQAEIKIANDANCFALAETKLGVVKQQYPKAKVVFGIIMGTGVGGGLVVNGQVINGLHGIGGEWGHNFLDQSGGECYCGKRGCVEQVLSGPSLERFYQQESGTVKRLKEIVDLANSDIDKIATKTIDRLTHFFGVAVSVLTNILDPDVIVVGGGLGNIDQLYTAGFHSLEQHIFNHQVKTPIVKPLLGDSAGVFGAAFL